MWVRIPSLAALFNEGIHYERSEGSTMKALLDADSLVYAAGFAVEKVSYYCHGNEQWYNNLTEAKEAGYTKESLDKVIDLEDLANALHLIDNMIESIVKETDCDDFVTILSGPDNYRKELATIVPYKGNRVAAKPVYFDEIKDYLVREYDAYYTDGIEADDECGILQMENPEEDTIIVSIDKDLDCVPGLHYNWRKKEKYDVSPEQAAYHFYKQLLTGDTVDNIKGCPNIGPKKAEKILETCTYNGDLYTYKCDMYEKVRNMYKEKYEDGDSALLENARLLWIQHKREELWEPPVRKQK